jgi:ketosteroid isomerase-like protein
MGKLRLQFINEQNMKLAYIFTVILVAAGCSGGLSEGQKTRAKNEILATEKAFQQMVREKGAGEAFIFYADENACIVRGERLIKGREEISAWYGKRQSSGMQLFWTPDFVDVSASGDIGYTYGTYTFTITDSTGSAKTGKGIFHTVWKRQEDGSWRYVWD